MTYVQVYGLINFSVRLKVTKERLLYEYSSSKTTSLFCRTFVCNILLKYVILNDICMLLACCFVEIFSGWCRNLSSSCLRITPLQYLAVYYDYAS